MRIASLAVLLTAVFGSGALGQQPDSITKRQAEIEAHPEYVIHPLASLRSGPSLDSSIVRIVERGTTTYVQASTGWWLRVRIRTESPPAGGYETATDLEQAYQSGWMHHTALSPEKPVLAEGSGVEERMEAIRRRLGELLNLRQDLAAEGPSPGDRTESRCPVQELRRLWAELIVLQRQLDGVNENPGHPLQIAANRLRTCLTCNPLLAGPSCKWAQKALEKPAGQD